MKIFSTVAFIVLGVIVFGHTQSETSAATSVFPKGNAKTGREMFEIQGCHRCHVIQGEKFPEIEKVISYQDTAVHLGTIYKAANWTQSNISSGGEWTRQSRARGKVQTAVPKVRWEFSL